MKRSLKKGQVFAHLTALQPSPLGQNMHWDFLCICGRITRVYKYTVMDGRNKSCGCVNRKRSATGAPTVRHGGTGTRLHNIWRDMLKRISATQGWVYEKYGARGISVCPEWHEYVPFRDWALANGYSGELTIDREDNDGNYEPGNCRWTTQREQCRNRRTSSYVEAFGRKQTLAAWEEETGIGWSLIRHRVRAGWPAEQAVTQLPNPKLTGRPRLK